MLTLVHYYSVLPTLYIFNLLNIFEPIEYMYLQIYECSIGEEHVLVLLYLSCL